MPPIYVTPELYHAIIQLSNQTPPPSQPAPSSSPSTIPPTVPTSHALDLINRLAGSLPPNPEITLEGSLEPNTLRECLTRYVPPRFAIRSRPHSRTQSPSSSSSDSLRTRSGNLLSYIPGPMSVTSTDVRDAVLPLLGTNKIRVRRTAEVGRLIVDEVNRYFPSDTSDASEDEAAGTVPALERSRTGTDATGSADEDVNMNSAETPLMPTDTGIFPQPTPDPLLSPSHALGRWVTYLYHAREIINAASSLRYEVHQTVAKHTTLGKAINDLIDHVWSLHPHPSPTTPNPTAIPANYPLSNAPHPPTVESATPHWVFPKESKSAGVPDWVCYFGDRTVACEEDKREEVMSNESMANIAGKASTGTVMGVGQGGFYIGLEAQGLRIKATYVSGSTLVLPEVEGLVLLQIWLEAHKNRSRWINLSNTQSTLIFYLANTYELLCSDNIPPDAGLQVDNLTIAAALFGTAVTRAVPAGAVLDADLQWLGPLSVSAQASEPMTSQGSQRSLSATQVQSQHQRRGTGTGNRGVGAGAGQKAQRSGVGGAVESDDTRDNGEQDVIRDNGEPDIIPSDMDALPIPEYQFDQPLLRVDLSSTPDSNIDGCADMNGSSTHPFPSLPDDPTLPHEKPSTTSMAKVMLRDRLGGGFTWTAYAASMMVSLDDHGQVLPIQSLMVEWDPGYWTEEAGTHDDLSESKAETTSPQVQRRYSLESISGPSTDHHEPTIQRFKTTSLVPENDLAHPLTIPRVSRQIQLQDITAPTNGSPGSTKSTNSSPSTHTTGTGAYSSSPPTSASPNRSAFPHRIHLANPLPQIKIDVCVKVCDPQVRSAEEDGDQDERLFVYNIVSEAELYASGEVRGLEGTVVPLSYGLFARSVDGGQKETVFVSVQQLAGGAVCDKWVDLHPSYKYSVLQAVQAMHAGGLLHGDLEPRHIRWATPCPSREPLLSGLRIIDLDRASLGSVEQRDEEMERLRAKIGWISPWPLKRTR